MVSFTLRKYTHVGDKIRMRHAYNEHKFVTALLPSVMKISKCQLRACVKMRRYYIISNKRGQNEQHGQLYTAQVLYMCEDVYLVPRGLSHQFYSIDVTSQRDTS
jgi:hypothetical protein